MWGSHTRTSCHTNDFSYLRLWSSSHFFSAFWLTIVRSTWNSYVSKLNEKSVLIISMLDPSPQYIGHWTFLCNYFYSNFFFLFLLPRLFGHLPSISRTIYVRRTRHASNCRGTNSKATFYYGPGHMDTQVLVD